MITFTSEVLLNSLFTNYIQIPFNQEHNHTYWEIFISLSGHCKQTLNKKTEDISAGTVYFLRPIKDVHYFETTNLDETYRHRDIYILDSDMRLYCNMIDPELYDKLYSAKQPVSFTTTSSIRKYIEELFSSQNDPNTDQVPLLKNMHFAATISLLVEYQKFQQQTNLLPDWLTIFIKELKKTDNFIYSIEELSSKIPYSHGYICREFKKYMKQTIVNFFNAQKVNYASFLLMNTNLKILDIATTIGYASPKNFINQFTKMYQMSPSEWRKKNQLSSRK